MTTPSSTSASIAASAQPVVDLARDHQARAIAGVLDLHLAQTAFHEAGHAVCAHVLKRSYHYVTIRPRKESRGHLQYGNLPEHFIPAVEFADPSWRRKAERSVMIHLAGHIAESIYTRFVLNEELSSQDLEEGSYDDLEHALRLIGYVLNTQAQEDVLAHLERLQARASDLVLAHFLAVIAVADGLLDQKTLRWRAARRIILDALAKRATEGG